MGGIADDQRAFAADGEDLLLFYYEMSVTSADASLRRLAAARGHELALRWFGLHPVVPAGASPDALLMLAGGAWVSERFGVPAGGLRKAIRRAAPAYSAKDFLGFDAALGPPPSILSVKARYDMWCDALITAYTGDLIGARFGATYAQVIRWLPAMRPYPPPVMQSEFDAVTYSITHAIYTLNRYNVYAVDRDCLGPEFTWLTGHLPDVIRLKDAETTGEFLDTLRSFGMTDADAPVRAGVEFLLSAQNADGSWGDPNGTDTYTRYHSTWTAIDGLREYRCKRARACPLPAR